MMNNIITSGANEICNNNNNPSVVTFVGLDDNNQKQFTNWETNNDHIPTNNNLNPNFINNPTTTNTIFDTYNSSSSSSSSTFASNNFISSNYSHFPNYPSSSFFKKHELDENGSIPFYNNNSSTTTTSSSNFDRRIGLNLGHRTYFSSTETTSSIIDPLSRRPRGGGFYFENHHHHQVPRCQAEGCMIDLSNAKHYHRRHKVCEFHSKATMVVAGGIEQRFCQQCSRFHVLAEFDESKRSCRKRLADHNRRRRKPHNQPSAPSDHSQLPPPSENATMSNKMGSSTSRSEVVIQERPSTSSNLSLMISKCSNNNNKQIQTSTSKDNLMIMSDNFMVSSSSPLQHQAFPLGVDDQVDDKQHLNSSTHYHDRSRPFISSTKTHDESMSTSLFIQRSSDENLFFSNANNSHEDCGSDRDNQNHNHNQEEDLHNLLQLGQSMFDVEFV